MGTATAQQGLCLWALMPGFSLWLVAYLLGCCELGMLLLGLSSPICIMGLAMAPPHRSTGRVNKVRQAQPVALGERSVRLPQRGTSCLSLFSLLSSGRSCARGSAPYLGSDPFILPEPYLHLRQDKLLPLL